MALTTDAKTAVVTKKIPDGQLVKLMESFLSSEAAKTVDRQGQIALRYVVAYINNYSFPGMTEEQWLTTMVEAFARTHSDFTVQRNRHSVIKFCKYLYSLGYEVESDIAILEAIGRFSKIKDVSFTFDPNSYYASYTDMIKRFKE